WLITHQYNETVTARFRLRERALDQRLADTVLAERRLDRQRTEQQRGGVADAYGRQPHRAHQQRADARGERQVEAVTMPLPQPVRGPGQAAGTERALVQPLDRDRVVGGFRQDGEGQIAHGWAIR